MRRFWKRPVVTHAPARREAAPEAPPKEAADAQIARGNALEDAGELAAALACYREALLCAPTYAKAYMNVGNALQKSGRFAEAILAMREATTCSPDFAPARCNLGALLLQSGDYAAAERQLREALKLQPTMAEAAVVLADVLGSTGRAVEAEAELQRALRIQPHHVGAALNLGLLYLEQERFDAAESTLLHARAIAPALGLVHAALGNLYLKTGRTAEASRVLNEALGLEPTLPDAQSALLFSLCLDADVAPDAVFEGHARAGENMVHAAGPPFTSWPGSPDPDRRLKVGYVSGDFRAHPVGLFLHPVLAQHDRASFDVYCYSNRDLVDDMTHALRRAADHWEVVARFGDDLLAKRIRDNEIDILVDLSGHTSGNRLGVFARHPAAVQVTWLGYLNTSGLPSMDYRLCDRYTDPIGATERFHTEQIYRMPHSQWCYAPIHDVPLVADPHPERPGALVFGSFNQYAKISDACLDLWCRILAEVPDATLAILDVPGGRTREMFLQRLIRRRIDPGRVVIHGRKSILDYFAAISSVDIALDTLPYNGATTTLDTLWMGVPIVALRGGRAISRSSYSIMRSLDLPELIAADPEEYVRLNVGLAHDPRMRRHLRGTLRDRLKLSPLMDSAGFVRDLEAAYRQMWRTWCQSRAA
jgi:protein O-GlcNAc transferase